MYFNILVFLVYHYLLSLHMSKLMRKEVLFLLFPREKNILKRENYTHKKNKKENLSRKFLEGSIVINRSKNSNL